MRIRLAWGLLDDMDDMGGGLSSDLIPFARLPWTA
jgi:hypothetical protein